ncbi:MAG: glutamine amidotransferase [Planctomycetaceae bacterium]
MKVLLEPVWPWPWIALAIAASLAVVIVGYRPRIAHLPRLRRTALLGLRVFAWLLLMFSLLRPQLEFTRIDPHGMSLIVLADSSRSMGVRDAAGGLTRREALLKTLGDAQPELESLKKLVDVVFVDFADDAAIVEQLRTDPLGDQTAIGASLERALQLAAEKRIAAFIVLSDFAQRAVAPRDLDPRAAASRLAEQQIRIDAVGIGTSAMSDGALDLSVEDLEVSPTVFVKNTVVVAAKIRALGAGNRELTVKLLIEDPAATVPGQPPPMKPAAPPRLLRPTGNQDVIPVEFDFVPSDAGEYRLMLEVVPIEGEAVTINNSQTTYLSVLKGGISVAYFDREHRTEQKFLRRVDESPDIRLDFKPVRLTPQGSKEVIEDDWFTPGKYDVYIIGSVPARAFGRQHLEQIARAVENGAGLLMTGGTLSFGPGGYAGTPLAEVLPVEMRQTEIQTGNDPDPTLHYLNRLQMLPTPQGLQHFIMRLDSPEKNLDRWKELPELEGANRYQGLKPLNLVLATTADNVPLLIAQDYGRGRTMAFAADTTWLWWAKFEAAHRRFWLQVILWLAHKDQQGDESVWVRLDSRRYRVGQPVTFTFGARDAQKRALDDAEFRVEVVEPGGKRRQLTPERSGNEHGARLLETQKPGEYRIHVEASRGGQAVGLPAEARFIVYEQDLELYNPAADFVLMEELVRITGGSSVAPEEFRAYLRRLAHQGLNLDVTEIRRVSLWDNWVLLGLFVASLTGEWFLRKKRGLV